jgi:hypothetical protein
MVDRWRWAVAIEDASGKATMRKGKARCALFPGASGRRIGSIEDRDGTGRSVGRSSQQPQQTGMLFIMTQQVQPAVIMSVMQSQQA